MATRKELQDELERLTGKKTNPALNKEAIQAEIDKLKESTESDFKFTPIDKPEEPDPFKEIEKQIKSSQKVKDGKRHLVYKDGREVWWTPSVIETMYKSFGPDRITFPENSQYILSTPKKCETCG